MKLTLILLFIFFLISAIYSFYHSGSLENVTTQVLGMISSAIFYYLRYHSDGQ
jgi:hypothetical protein